MKLRTLQITGLIMVLAGLAAAEENQNFQGERPPRREGGPMSAEAILSKYDTNKDGMLSKTELETFVKEMKSRRPRGEGPGGRGGSFDREAMLKKYDKDGDGKLSEEERQAMFEDIKARRNQSDE